MARAAGCRGRRVIRYDFWNAWQSSDEGRAMARAVQRISRRRALEWAAGLAAAAVGARAQDDGEGGRGHGR